MSEETKELVVIEEANIPALFAEGGSDPIIEGLENEAAKFEGDISTKKGRDEIKSFARKFSTSKTYLEGLGKALSDEYRAKIAPINDERNKIKACCDELRDKVRKPLTDWEDAKKKRVADIEARIQEMNDYLELTPCTSTEAENILKEINAIVVDESFEEFELAAKKAKAAAVTQLEAKFIVLQNQEKEKAEGERLEQERIEKERIKREERIAKEAAEQATKEAEEKAKAEQGEKDRVAQEAIDKAEKEKLEAQLATEKAEREKREAAEQAEQEKQEAIEADRKEREEAKRQEAEKEEKRQANMKHRNKIHKEAKASMLENGISEENATIFVTMVKDGLVKHIIINY